MNPDILKNCRRLITHDNCPDGLASAMLIKNVLPDIEVEFVQYNTEHHRTLKPTEHDMFCDFTPHRDTVDAFIAAGTVVLDHHKGAQDIVERFGSRGVFADEKDEPGVAGATVAFREVWMPMAEAAETTANAGEYIARRAHDFATLAGIRDTWQRNDARWIAACAQAEALMFYGAGYFLGGAGRYTDDRRILVSHEPYLRDDEFGLGRMLFDKKIERAKEAARRVYRMGDFAIMNDIKLTSDTAEQLRLMGSNAKALASFGYTTDEATGNLIIIWSLRSIAENFDVSKIAKANGGGGHTKAAGFSHVVAGKGGSFDGSPTIVEFNKSPLDLFECALGRAIDLSELETDANNPPATP